MNARRLKFALLHCWFAVVVALPVAALAEAPPAGAPADIEIATAPVEIDGKVLFTVRGAWTYPAELRARVIRERIETVARNHVVAVDALRVVPTEAFTAIMAGDEILMGVADEDARLAGIARDKLAESHLGKIRLAIDEYRYERRGEALAESSGKALVATLALIAGLLILSRLWRYVDGRISERMERLSRSLEERSLQGMHTERIGGFLRLGWRLFGTLCLLTALILFSGYLLKLFPATRPLGTHFFSLLLEPLLTLGRALVAEIPALLFLAVLFLLVRFALRGLHLLSEAVAQGSVTFAGFDAEWAKPSYNLARLMIIFFALVVAYPHIPGADSDAFKGISIFFGVILSLGSTSAVSNTIAGYMLLYRRAFKVGDRVKIGSAVGDVTETGVQVTRLRTLKNEEVIIPNSQILTSDVVNYSAFTAAEGLILHTTVGIGYEVPWRQVEAMLLEAAGRTPGLLRPPAPFVLQKSLGDFAVNYELNVHCQDAKTMTARYTDLHRNIQDVFNEYGVQIMTPAYEGDPEVPKIVPKSEWYAAPATPPHSVGSGED